MKKWYRRLIAFLRGTFEIHSVVTTTPNFSTLSASNPNLTPIAALSIST